MYYKNLKHCSRTIVISKNSEIITLFKDALISTIEIKACGTYYYIDFDDIRVEIEKNTSQITFLSEERKEYVITDDCIYSPYDSSKIESYPAMRYIDEPFYVSFIIF